MTVAGDPGHRGARLALAAGAEIEHLAVVKLRALFLGEQPDVFEIAARARRAHIAMQRAPDEHRLPPRVPRSKRDRFQTGDIGGKEGHGQAVLALGDQARERFAHLAFRARFAFDRRIGGVADQRQHAGLARPPQCSLIEGSAHQRVGIDLPIAGVHDTPVRRLDQQRVGLRDRMSERNEGERERPEFETARKRHLVERHFREQFRVQQLLAQDRGGERGRVHRAAESRPEIGHRAQVILVCVGQHDGEQVLPALLDEGRVRHDHVDPRQRVAREGDAEIDHQPRALAGIEVEVHADLPCPAEGQEVQRVALDAGCCRRRGHVHCFSRLRRWTSRRPRIVRSGSTASMTDVASPKRPASPPVATVVTGASISAFMRATIPSISPT